MGSDTGCDVMDGAGLLHGLKTSAGSGPIRLAHVEGFRGERRIETATTDLYRRL